MSRVPDAWGPHRPPVSSDDADWVTYEVDEQWAASALLVRSQGAARIAELHIHPRNDRHGIPDKEAERLLAGSANLGGLLPEGGLTSHIVRQAVLQPAIEECQRRTSAAHARGGLRRALADWRKRLDVTELSRAQLEETYTSTELRALLAARYTELAEQSRAPNPVLAKEFDLPVEKVRDELNAARRQKLLSRPYQRGIAGGRLTDKGEHVVEAITSTRDEYRRAEEEVSNG